MSSLILASQSLARRQLLMAAGLDVTNTRPALDEEAAKEELLRADPGITPAKMAEALAARKASSVSAVHKSKICIGADQILSLGQVKFSKPKSVTEAKSQLLQLRGKTHHLETAVACARDGQIIWSHLARPALTMRMFDEAFLDQYLKRMGETVTETVGGYKLEGLGIQLFERIEGDYFSILGMPLLELLAFLRARGETP